MLRQKFLSSLLIFLLSLLVISCSDSKPSKLITNLSDDFNTTIIDVQRSTQITVYADFDDGTKEDVTDTLIWSSSDSSLATVSNGLVKTGNSTGVVEIKYETDAKDLDNNPIFEKTYTLSVRDLVLVDINLSEKSLSLYEGDSKAVVAMGIFEDNLTSQRVSEDITDDCNWSSSDSKISSVSNGVIKAISAGSATITATDLGISSSLSLEVKPVVYTGLEITASSTDFNVKQDLILYVSAITSNDAKVLLDSSALTWSNSDESIVSLSGNTATALKKGSVTLKATLKDNTSLNASIELSVIKEKYLRIFKNGVELSFPYAGVEEYSGAFPTEFDTFKLEAVGANFTIENLAVTDINGSELEDKKAYFDGITNGETIFQDSSVNYRLVNSGSAKELHFHYNIDDDFKSSFSQKYILK